jgi:hypothetical protein
MPKPAEPSTTGSNAGNKIALLFGTRLWDLVGLVAILTAATIGTATVLRLKGRKALNERDVYDN